MSDLSSNLAFSLRWFSMGNYIDVCNDICNQEGRLFPSEASGIIIKKGKFQSLLVRSFLQKELTEIHRTSYWRVRITELGKKAFEEYKHDCSK